MTAGSLRINGIGRYLPSRRLPTRPRAGSLGISVELLESKIGITAQAVKDPDETTTDMAEKAVADLLDRHADLPLDEVGLLCVVTQNPEQRIPHTAALLHHRLGLPARCMTFDISQGCAGFVHGLAIATSAGQRLGARHALLVTADPYSEIVSPDDRESALLFGDAATATWLHDGPGLHVGAMNFGTVPGSSQVLTCRSGFAMQGREVFLHAVRHVPASIATVLAEAGLRSDEIAAYLVHPGSLALIRKLRSLLRVDEARCPFAVAEYGNPVSSSIPLMLLDGPRNPGPLVLCGFGVGFSWGTCLVEEVAS